MFTPQQKAFAKAVYDLESALEEIKDCEAALRHVQEQVTHAKYEHVIALAKYERTYREMVNWPQVSGPRVAND